MSRERVIIVGAGMAGAATAYFTTLKGLHDVVLLEKEKIAGTQSTGRNAAILRTMIPDPTVNRIARESALFYHNPPGGFASVPLVNKVGVFLAACAEHAPTLNKWCDDNPDSGIQRREAGILYERIPALAPGLTLVGYSPDDGVLDVHEILQGFIRGACRKGAELCLDREFKSLEARNGRVIGVETSAGFMEASKVVVANGAWASLSETFKGYALPFTPYRRHLLVTEPLPQVRPDWPVVWIVGEEFYFRPESGGLLMSGCDTVKVTPDQGEITDQSELEKIAVKASSWIPSLADAGVARSWAGMRTFAPDERFVVGADPRLKGLYWVAGLGGHGITCAAVYGRVAADWIVEGHSSHPSAAMMSPQRLVTGR
jgi:glycine/D-amino acid oxidase-like deaminating enzyme